MRSAVTCTGGSKIWKKSLTVGILRSNLTGAGNAITEPVEKWVEAVRDGIATEQFLMRYNYHRGSSEHSILVELQEVKIYIYSDTSICASDAMMRHTWVKE